MPALAPLMRPVHLVRGIRHFAGNVRCCHVAGDATPRTHLSARIQPSPLNRHLFTLESSDGRSIAPPANLDAIVVLAGGLLADGQCPEWTGPALAGRRVAYTANADSCQGVWVLSKPRA
ncbi:hypothetical protein HaLaN_10049 [Haematococcus lacustris]|uniref:Uncharacterized protein n=1 Tax=Haematococcus lacustris TaxID=44745 RepID=A0A699YWH8_HAELA|nr:hypothetical protein HaLaN_10049 [Haematococcus lacustris]